MFQKMRRIKIYRNERTNHIFTATKVKRRRSEKKRWGVDNWVKITNKKTNEKIISKTPKFSAEGKKRSMNKKYTFIKPSLI